MAVDFWEPLEKTTFEQYRPIPVAESADGAKWEHLIRTAELPVVEAALQFESDLYAPSSAQAHTTPRRLHALVLLRGLQALQDREATWNSLLDRLAAMDMWPEKKLYRAVLRKHNASDGPAWRGPREQTERLTPWIQEAESGRLTPLLKAQYGPVRTLTARHGALKLSQIEYCLHTQPELLSEILHASTFTLSRKQKTYIQKQAVQQLQEAEDLKTATEFRDGLEKLREQGETLTARQVQQLLGTNLEATSTSGVYPTSTSGVYQCRWDVVLASPTTTTEQLEQFVQHCQDHQLTVSSQHYFHLANHPESSLLVLRWVAEHAGKPATHHSLLEREEAARDREVRQHLRENPYHTTNVLIKLAGWESAQEFREIFDTLKTFDPSACGQLICEHPQKAREALTRQHLEHILSHSDPGVREAGVRALQHWRPPSSYRHQENAR